MYKVLVLPKQVMHERVMPTYVLPTCLRYRQAYVYTAKSRQLFWLLSGYLNYRCLGIRVGVRSQRVHVLDFMVHGIYEIFHPDGLNYP